MVYCVFVLKVREAGEEDAQQAGHPDRPGQYATLQPCYLATLQPCHPDRPGQLPTPNSVTRFIALR